MRTTRITIGTDVHFLLFLFLRDRFQGGQPGDLSFVQGERISLLEKVSDDWFRARNAEGHIGIVPTNYIERM